MDKRTKNRCMCQWGERMEEKDWALGDWITAAEEYSPVDWERLPELELYMDQVITFMNKQLEPFTYDGERLLTPSMINNYVKDGVLPRPVQKKYGRDHLVMLLMICLLKSVLSLPEIDATLHGLTEKNDIQDIYPYFLEKQNASLQQVTRRIQEQPDHSDESLYRLALELALEANACHTAAARILDSLETKERAKERDKANEKSAKKSKKSE